MALASRPRAPPSPERRADLNVPESVREGTLDWMGMAHMLGERGAASELVSVGSRVPLLEPDQILLLGWGPEQATAFEREAIERRGIPVLAVDEVAADPESAAARARESMENRCDRLLVHFDVDVIDFTDVPLSENHAATYVTVNGTLIGVWELTGHGLFWPGLVLAPMTAVLGLHAAVSRWLRRRLRIIRGRGNGE